MKNANEFARQYVKAAQALGIKPEAYDVHTRRIMPPRQGETSYLMVCNVYKENRPRAPPKPAAQGQKPDCGLCKDINRATTKGDNAMFDGDYKPFAVLPNPFPFDFGHVMLVDTQHSSDYYRVPTKEKLETIVRFEAETGARGWRNVYGTNSSVPGHEHTHAMQVQFPAEFIATQQIANGIEELVSFPGQHIVFSGENRATLAHEFITNLQNEQHPNEEMQKIGIFPYVSLFAGSKIYLAPVRVPQYPQPGNIGAGEIFGVYATPVKKKLLDRDVTDEKWNSMSAEERANTILQIQSSTTHEEIVGSIRYVLFQQGKDAFDIRKLVKA